MAGSRLRPISLVMKMRDVTLTERYTRLVAKKPNGVDRTGKGSGGRFHDHEDMVFASSRRDPTIRV